MIVKHLLIILILSILIIFSLTYSAQLVHGLIQFHHWIANELVNLFSSSQPGSMLRELIAILIPPFIIAMMAALVYWLIRRRLFPYFSQLVWVVWLVEIGALMMLHG